ncbi:MAG: tRNA pseudouridine(38-40) synthase TruA [Proteobacteria bacterium]|nr:tRNA pseudouridine(38-40) synthase TruA [Pseudomonadota bacterium]
MRIALGLEYDGSRFLGWQTQTGGGTVQDALQSALASIAGAPVTVVAAGRTDRGVHATRQVVHFDAPVDRPLTAWVKGVNAFLPSAIAIQWAIPVPPAFHARFSATERGYRYVLVNRAVRPALLSRYAGWQHGSLDLAAMREAAAVFRGQHDFSAFRSAECQARSPVRTLHVLEIETHGTHRIEFLFRANAFLHHMVRNIVGTLIYVGKKRLQPAAVEEILASRDRARAAPTFQPEGLYLVDVVYPAQFGIPERPHADLLLEAER